MWPLPPSIDVSIGSMWSVGKRHLRPPLTAASSQRPAAATTRTGTCIAGASDPGLDADNLRDPRTKFRREGVVFPVQDRKSSREPLWEEAFVSVRFMLCTAVCLVGATSLALAEDYAGGAIKSVALLRPSIPNSGALRTPLRPTPRR